MLCQIETKALTTVYRLARSHGHMWATTMTEGEFLLAIVVADLAGIPRHRAIAAHAEEAGDGMGIAWPQLEPDGDSGWSRHHSTGSGETRWCIEFGRSEDDGRAWYDVAIVRPAADIWLFKFEVDGSPSEGWKCYHPSAGGERPVSMSDLARLAACHNAAEAPDGRRGNYPMTATAVAQLCVKTHCLGDGDAEAARLAAIFTAAAAAEMAQQCAQAAEEAQGAARAAAWAEANALAPTIDEP